MLHASMALQTLRAFSKCSLFAKDDTNGKRAIEKTLQLHVNVIGELIEVLNNQVNHYYKPQ